MMKFLRRRARAEAGQAVEEVDTGIYATARAEAFWRRWEKLLPEVSAALGGNEPRRVEH